MADAYFRLTNTVAFAAWIVLLLLPGQRRVSGWLCAWVVPALLAASYAAIIATKLLLGGGEQSGDIMTMDGLRQAFADDWVFAAAWTHYLAFDMVVGAGIARDAVRRGMPWWLRTACLVGTFLLGPAGFLLHVATRSLFPAPPAAAAEKAVPGDA